MYLRYAIYHLAQGPLADAGAAWLGWDAAAARAVPQPAVPGLDIVALTATPRKYGFHATIKAPFQLVPGVRQDDLAEGVTALARTLAPVPLDGLVLSDLSGFVGVVPLGDATALNGLAATVVRSLDRFRAPLTPDGIARKAGGLTPRQADQLVRWGYPFVFDDFRFHMTLTGPVPDPAPILAVLGPRFAPVLPRPYDVDSLSLLGQGADGFFHELHRYALTG